MADLAENSISSHRYSTWTLAKETADGDISLSESHWLTCSKTILPEVNWKDYYENGYILPNPSSVVF